MMKKGDTVRRKSDGQLMTIVNYPVTTVSMSVTKITGEYIPPVVYTNPKIAECEWKEGTENKKEFISLDDLEEVDPSPTE